MSLLEKLKKNSKIKETISLDKSTVFETKEFIKTDVPILNLALSGDIDGGLTAGLTLLAAPSRHFKCLDGSEEIEIYAEDENYSNPNKIKIKDLVDCFNREDRVGEPIRVNSIKVKTPEGNLVSVNACIKKPKENIFKTVFSDGSKSVEIKSSEQHLLFNGKDCQTVKEIEEIVLQDGTKMKKISSEVLYEDYLYDISIPYPHLYTTPNGMIHHNTSYALIMAKGFLDKFKDGVILFYDSEFGSPEGYWNTFGIDPSRVIHTPITNIEELKFDLVAQLDGIDRKDNVFILIDSIGNLASKKEVEDALKENAAADMTRAKQLKSLFRMITPFLTLKNIPCVAINHVYQEMACLHGETLVKTVAGTKQIKDIVVGDRVFGTTGIQNVTYTYKPEELDSTDKTFLELEFDDGSKVKCTGNHLFLTKENEWVRADDLVLGQEFR